MPDAVALAMVEALPATAPTVGWQTIGSFAGVRYAAAVSTDGTRIYASHGYAGSAGAVVSGQVMTASGVLDNMPAASVARQGVAGVWCNGKHYAIGGLNSSNQALGTVETYTPAGSNGASGVWSAVATKPDPSGYGAAAVIGNSIYHAGGQAGSSAGLASNTLNRYDTTSNTWTPLASMPAARTQGAMVAVGSKLYYLGGLDSNGTAQATVYVFDTTAGTWTTGVALPSANVATPAVTVAGSIYYLTGNRVFAIFNGTSWTLGDGQLTPAGHGNFGGAAVIAGAIYYVSGSDTANVDKLDLSAGVGFTSAVLGAKSLLNPLLAGVAATLPNTPPTATSDRNAYAQTVQTLKALTYIS